MTDSMEYEADRIERELVLPASPEQVWEVVTGSGWLADEVELDLAPGGDARFRSDDSLKEGWVEEAIAPEPVSERGGRLVFWWAREDEVATRVELTLEPEGDDCTRLRVCEARALELLDVVGIPVPGSGGTSHGPALLVAA